MQILEGMVQDVGYPDEKCIYAKMDDNTLYYFIKDYKLSNGNIIATTNLKEAIGHASYTSLGLINQEGKVLIPFENKSIKAIQDDLLLVEKNVPTSESVVEALKNKSDPFAAQSYAEKAATIKKQIKEAMGMNGDFIFDNQFSECAIYTMDGINIANNYFSFISENNSNYYLATNVEGSTIMKFNPNQLEQTEEDSPSENIQENTQEPIEQQAVSAQNGIEEKSNAEEENDSSVSLDIDIPIKNQIDSNQIPNVDNSTEQNELTNPIVNIEQGTQPNETQVNNNIEQAELTIPTVNIEQSAQPSETQVNNNVEQTDSEETSLSFDNAEENTQTDEAQEEDSEEQTEPEEISLSFDNLEENTQTNETEEDDSEEQTESEETSLSFDNVEENTQTNEAQEDDSEEQTESEETSLSFDNIEENTQTDEAQEEDSEDQTESDENNNKLETNEVTSQNYNLTDEDIATPTIKDATNTIKKLLEENRKQRKLIDKQIGEIEALKTNGEILREENFSKEQEIQSLRQEMNEYRTQSINLARENTKIKGTLTRQCDIMHNLEQQNIILRNQVSGMHALSNAVAEANVLVQPVDADNQNVEPYQESSLDIDNYLNRNYTNNNQKITYSNFGYLDDNNQQASQESTDGVQSYQKKMAA